MYRLKEWPGAGDPFGDAVTPLLVVRFLKISVKAMVVDGCAGNFVRAAGRDGVISINDVLAGRRFKS